MVKWADIANHNPFETDASKAAQSTEVETSATMAQQYYIKTTDGRDVPVTVDMGTRSVYPVRKM